VVTRRWIRRQRPGQVELSISGSSTATNAGVNETLNAAALTYVAAFSRRSCNLLWLLSIAANDEVRSLRLAAQPELRCKPSFVFNEHEELGFLMGCEIRFQSWRSRLANVVLTAIVHAFNEVDVNAIGVAPH